MPRVHRVESARKAKPEHGIEVGKPYYWWKTRMTIGKSYVGRIHYSLTPPKQSQVTSNAFQSALLAVQEQFDAGFDTPDAAESQIESAKDELESLKDEQEDKLNNMPEGLQQGSSGELLQERIDGLDSLIQELDGIDTEWDESAVREEIKTDHSSEDEEDGESPDDDEEYERRLADRMQGDQRRDSRA